MFGLKKIVNIKHIIELFLMVFIYAVFDNVGGMKKYVIVSALCILFFWLGRKKRWSPEILLCVSIPAIIYITMGALSVLLSVNAQFTSFKVILYWIMPLIFVGSMYVFYESHMEHIVDVQFLGSILGYAVFDAPYWQKIFRWESVYAFVFGIFAVYYVYNKKWKLFIIATLFLLFAEKRIAILALIGSVIVMFFCWLFRHHKKLIYFLWGSISVLICGYLYLICSGSMEKICWAANINTNGRVEIYSRVAQEFPITLFGNGLGFIEQMLEYWNVSVYSNLHNDLLKIFIELGVVGFVIFLLSYGVMFAYGGRIAEKSKVSYLLCIIVYTMILFATDNVSIYIIYLVPFYSTLFAVLSSEKEETTERRNGSDAEIG